MMPRRCTVCDRLLEPLELELELEVHDRCQPIARMLADVAHVEELEHERELAASVAASRLRRLRRRSLRARLSELVR